MDFTPSQYSEGGESGWTLYLDQSSENKEEEEQGVDYYYCYGDNKGVEVEEEEDEGESLSMVSDASSGPRYYYGDEDCNGENHGFYSSSPSSNEISKRKKKKKSKNSVRRPQEQYAGGVQRVSCLDDTASSPVQGFPQDFDPSAGGGSSVQHVVDFSQGFSATRHKSKSAICKHLGVFNPSKQASEEKKGGIQRRARG